MKRQSGHGVSWIRLQVLRAKGGSSQSRRRWGTMAWQQDPLVVRLLQMWSELSYSMDTMGVVDQLMDIFPPNRDEYQLIDAQPTNLKKNRLFLRAIHSRGPNGVKRMLSALEITQRDLVERFMDHDSLRSADFCLSSKRTYLLGHDRRMAAFPIQCLYFRRLGLSVYTSTHCREHTSDRQFVLSKLVIVGGGVRKATVGSTQICGGGIPDILLTLQGYPKLEALV